MCGIAAIVGEGARRERIESMIGCLRHRGPDSSGVRLDPRGDAALGHARLAILDLSPAGSQPMASPDGNAWIVFNGEVYNYLELRRELGDWPWRSRSDTEVVLAAWQRWGERCLDRFVGMFAFVVWDEREHRLFAARDRFGVKPLYHAADPSGRGRVLASEIKAIHAAGAPRAPDDVAWATYLATGVHEHSERTFWRGVRALPPGHWLSWQDGRLEIRCWYDLAERTGAELDGRPEGEVAEEYLALMEESVRLRFRSDVPVGINVSGGLDSSALLAMVERLQGGAASVKAFTFVTGDPAYDELPWVERMLARTAHPSAPCLLSPEEVPELARSVQAHEDEPYGGLPTLAYARLFEEARRQGVIVLLDGQGLDEQWAGYDYYADALAERPAGIVQGTRDRPVRPDCLAAAFRAQGEELVPTGPFPDALRNMQYRDVRFTKMPRALRFNDRVSMRSSTELREPFLDHRLFELALRQPAGRKIHPDGTKKWLLRRLLAPLLPAELALAPKRPLQTPQREWLRGPLAAWADACIEHALAARGGAWLVEDLVRRTWEEYRNGAGENSFYIWQWITMGMML